MVGQPTPSMVKFEAVFDLEYLENYLRQKPEILTVLTIEANQDFLFGTGTGTGQVKYENSSKVPYLSTH